ncbi:hypothetical protein ACFOQM_18420 [Paenibacillus sp. GCM10012307]|uniref:Uncharacterized protein n=1 Tax=Paenibacillus roseus TaxID=2798579 RepID=A0A934J1R3_9BACL|nr:hypothetical protein [Paenibacillus roseus]MBJ6363197.1 hypothetical protein [Paenibacillus roseus]
MGKTINELYSLDEILYKLLHERSYRQLFLEDKFYEMNISEVNIENLKTIDREELMATAKTIKSNIISGNIDYNGGLKSAYPGVFSEFKESSIDMDDLLYDFIESIWFQDYKEIPFSGRGICIEEAFYHYMLSNENFINRSPYNTLLLQHEFLNAIHSILVINKNPNFRIHSPLIIHNRSISYSVVKYPGKIVSALENSLKKFETDDEVLYVYAATKKHLIKGQISELISEILKNELLIHKAEIRNLLTTKFNINEDQLNTTILNMAKLGLLDG